MYSGVHPGVCDGRGQEPQREAEPGLFPADGRGEGEPRRRMPGRERRGSRHPHVPLARNSGAGPVWPLAGPDGLDTKVHQRRGDADGQCSPHRRTSAGAAPRHGQPGRDGQPEARVIRGVGEPAQRLVEARSGRSGHCGVDRPVHGTQLMEPLGDLLAGRPTEVCEPVSQALPDRLGGVS